MAFGVQLLSPSCSFVHIVEGGCEHSLTVHFSHDGDCDEGAGDQTAVDLTRAQQSPAKGSGLLDRSGR